MQSPDRFNNNFEAFPDKVKSCLTNIFLDARQVHDIYRLKYLGYFNYVALEIVENTLENLSAVYEIDREVTEKKVVKYKKIGEDGNNIVPFPRRTSLIK